MVSNLEPIPFRELLDEELKRLGSLDSATLALDIPHIAGWTVHSVVGHIGWVLRFVSLCVEASPEDPPPRSSVGEPPVGSDVIGWFEQSVSMATSAIDNADLEEARPTWIGPQPGHWWLRRIAQEVAMHRWDVENAVGQPEPINPQLARDGVDEVLEVFVPNRLQFDVLDADGSTIHLHATDIDHGEWLIHVTADAVRWEHAHAKGDVAARGTMSDLLLMMWGRISPSQLEVFGDVELLERWQRAATF